VKYLLDTNSCVLILRRGPNAPVAIWLSQVAPTDVALCSVVVGELVFGALRSRDIAKNLAETRVFASGFRSLPFDDSVAEIYAAIRADLAAKGTPIGPNDLMIAAIALANSLILVTHNTAEFSRVVGLTLDDWQI
jgi:tRNA(fMet)-specific endonuclease VapC